MTKPALPLAFALAAATALPQSAAAETPIPGIDGRWQSMACEVRPQVGQDGKVAPWWVTRDITFADGTIEARFTTYGAPGCQFPLNELHFKGRVDVHGPSAVHPAAFEADLTIDAFVNITPLAQGFADFLNSAPEGLCGETWALGEAQDVLPIGCALLGVEPNTPTVEYELLAVVGDQLYFGARRVDGQFLTTPEDRPQALLVPLNRAE